MHVYAITAENKGIKSTIMLFKFRAAAHAMVGELKRIHKDGILTFSVDEMLVIDYQVPNDDELRTATGIKGPDQEPPQTPGT